MCGIAGYFGREKLESSKVDKCLALMQQRGPDDRGAHVQTLSDGTTLYLLHTRLSIIDLANRARQPFIDSGNALCFNGEIYNYLEIRSKLEANGHTFATTSDTEVLAKLLTLDGLDSVASCEGMWSFAWFNNLNHSLHLCRDRFGEKPLYVYEGRDGVYFGSEPKFIFALLGRVLNVNIAQVKRYLVNGYKSLYKGSDTFFEGLREIAPGTYRVYNNSDPQTHYFWRPNFDQHDEHMGYEDAVARTRDALIHSVEIRLRSDVPIAFCLSGGVDSNALIALAKREFGYDVHGFTVMNTDARYEEREMVELAVQQLELRHTEVPVVTDHFLENLRSLICYHDAPIYTITYYAQWRLMQAVHEKGYKVSISGTGADELFSGYFDHHNAYLAAMSFEDPDRYREALKEWRTVVSPIVRNPFLGDPEYMVRNPGRRDHIYLDSDVFSSILCQPYSEPFVESQYSKTLLRNRMANELFHESVPVILHEDDLNSMYYSIENRSPYLDTSLFELSQAIPTRHLIRRGRAKAILRDAVRGIAPDAVIDNPRKVGFNIPLFDYLDIDNPEVRQELFSDSPIYDIVKREEIMSLLSPRSLSNSHSKFLFNFICAKIFLEEYAG